MGTPKDMRQRLSKRRQDTAQRKALVDIATRSIFEFKHAVDGEPTYRTLNAMSLTPTKVSSF